MQNLQEYINVAQNQRPDLDMNSSLYKPAIYEIIKLNGENLSKPFQVLRNEMNFGYRDRFEIGEMIRNLLFENEKWKYSRFIIIEKNK
jgi:hypothetical protein